MLNEGQLYAIELLAVPGTTAKEAALKVGVSQNTMVKWRRKPEFQAELKRTIQQSARNGAPDVLAAMRREAVENGNSAAAKLYLQAAGLLDNQSATEELEAASKATSTEELQRRLAQLKSNTG